MTIARLKPGENVPAFCPAQVRGDRFVSIAGPLTAQGDIQIAESVAGQRAFGVAERDSAPPTQPARTMLRRVNVVRRGGIAHVIAGAPIVAGEYVASDAQGRAVPVAAVAAAPAVLEQGAGNSRIRYTARDAGDAGNGISVQHRNPAAASQALSITVNGNDIVVNLATDAASAITSTVAQVVAAIAASAAANALVAAANGTGSDGTGVIAAAAATNLAGGKDAGQTTASGQAVSTQPTVDARVLVDLL